MAAFSKVRNSLRVKQPGRILPRDPGKMRISSRDNRSRRFRRRWRWRRRRRRRRRVCLGKEASRIIELRDVVRSLVLLALGRLSNLRRCDEEERTSQATRKLFGENPSAISPFVDDVKSPVAEAAMTRGVVGSCRFGGVAKTSMAPFATSLHRREGGGMAAVMGVVVVRC